jgi:hypothetical protein
MKVTWTCPYCRHQEKTSPHVKTLSHVHGKTETPLLPYKKPMKARGVDTVKSLDGEVWALFSEYVRRSAADDNGYCQCVTCKKIDHWKNMQAGHYLSRRFKAIKFDVRNVHVQCPLCNGFGHGMIEEYTAFMLTTYGRGTIDTLEYLSKQRHDFTIYELQQYRTNIKKNLEGLGWHG